MRRGGIARTGEARRFGRYWFGCVKTGEQPFATRLTRNPHEGNKGIGCRAGRAAGAATCRFDFSVVLDAVRCADVEIISPRDAVIWIAVTYLDARVTFRRIPSGNRLIVDIGIVNSAIRVDRDRRIGALDLRDAARDNTFTPSGTAIRAHSATFRRSA